MKGKLNLDWNKVEEARNYSRKIADAVHNFVNEHTTVSVERAICRLLGIDGVDEYDVPMSNVVVDHLKELRDDQFLCVTAQRAGVVFVRFPIRSDPGPFWVELDGACVPYS